jgi:formamidopyrimidine-DNA glycosylase
MPELPEVETIARGLARRVSGDVIESIWLGRKPEPLKSSAQEIAATLEHSRIATVRRMGKHIVFDLEQNDVARAPLRQAQGRLSPSKSQHSNARAGSRAKPSRPLLTAHAEADEGVRPTQPGPVQAQWIVHLGMTGRLQVCEAQEDILKHTHAILKLASGKELRFVDPRRFGRLSVARAGGFEAGGIEPLEADLDRFLALFRGRKTPIKSALLNQKLLRGVGNIYADESLFRAGIRPRRRASTITAIIWPSCSRRSKRFFGRRLLSAARLSQTTLTPTVKKASSNCSTASTAAKVSPAWSARPPSSAS